MELLNHMTDTFTFYHNPRCSKSRQTLALLQEHGVTPQIVLYLETPPSASQLKALLGALELPARELLRRSEEAYRTLGLANTDLTEDELIQAMVKHPKLIERPIVTVGKRAVLGRPPENVLSLL